MTDAPPPLEGFIEERFSAADYDKLYSGASGIVMKAGHRLMERGISPAQNAHVLEIGGGAMSHFDWINAEQMKSYTVSDKMRLYQKKMDALRTRLPSGATLVLHDFEADSMLLSLSGPYTRIIASHVLEHIPDAEAAITKWNALLSPDGIISIALPCDPGWAWQLGRLIAFKGLETGLTLTEYDLVASREHVNSVQRILQIVRYYYRRLSIRWFPMIVPVVDFNLVCVINVSASDHRDRNHRALS